MHPLLLTFFEFLGRPPGFSPLPPDGRRTRQRLVEVRTFSYWFGNVSWLIERDPPILPVVKVFWFWHSTGVILFCKNVPCTTNIIIISIVLGHSVTENMISQESIMDSFELSLNGYLKNMGQMIFYLFRKFPISVAMRPSLLDYVFCNIKEVQRKHNETSIGHCFFLEMPACAIDDVHLVQHCLLVTWFVTIYNGLPGSITNCFVSNVQSHAFKKRTCLGTIWHNICVFQQRVAPFCHVPFQRWDSCCHQMNVFGFFLFQQRVAPFYRFWQFFSWKNVYRFPGNGTFFFHLARFSC